MERAFIFILIASINLFAIECRYEQDLIDWPNKSVIDLLISQNICIGRQFIPMQTGNISYATAMELSPMLYGWDVNVVGSISQDITGEIVNHYHSSYSDDIESVFKFTIFEPKILLIGVTPEAITTDLDLFVVSNERPNGDFFDAAEHFDPTIDFAAAGGGCESVARLYPPGTYYILVSLFEGDAAPFTDFGLLLTEHPIYLNCFENEGDFDRHNQAEWIDGEDHNGLADWEIFNWMGVKYGKSLSQLPGGGLPERSGLETPFLEIPPDGVTIVDVDSGMLLTDPLPNIPRSFKLFVHHYGQTTLNLLDEFEFSAGQDGNAVIVNGNSMGLAGWSRWIKAIQYTGGTPLGYTLEPGTKVGLVTYCENSDQRWLIDNFRVFNIRFSLNQILGSKKATLVSSGKRPK